MSAPALRCGWCSSEDAYKSVAAIVGCIVCAAVTSAHGDYSFCNWLSELFLHVLMNIKNHKKICSFFQCMRRCSKIGNQLSTLCVLVSSSSLFYISFFRLLLLCSKRHLPFLPSSHSHSSQFNSEWMIKRALEKQILFSLSFIHLYSFFVVVFSQWLN